VTEPNDITHPPRPTQRHDDPAKRSPARFHIVWKREGFEDEHRYTNSKIVATSWVTVILQTDLGAQVEEASSMEYLVRADGTYDTWNKVRVVTITITTLVGPS
jgi:hypothetical protein